ncbi:hypothetical protein [Mycobacterium angelicum]|uniref:hypothetical protein n=1 Tax=Mycobacterium angelicum TaxID=470074 RepID=UPI00111BD654|nr:hypothetical protein [Mycobacterium angelicum]MCV7199590.1 hypothetical protein [Mycobacterium angelicum]
MDYLVVFFPRVIGILGRRASVDEIISDMQLALKISLLIAGTGHVGSKHVIDAELEARYSAIASGAARPIAYYDFASRNILDAPSDTALSLAAFVAIVDPGPARTWEEGLRPDPADQPPVMKLFAALMCLRPRRRQTAARSPGTLQRGWRPLPAGKSLRPELNGDVLQQALTRR